MSRVEIIGDCTLYLGDCLEILPTLGKVDAVVTDPPYGVAFRGEAWDATIPDWLPSAREIAPIVLFTTGTLTVWDYPRADWILLWHRPASSSRSKLGGFSHWSPILAYGPVKFPVDAIYLHAIQHAQESGFGHPSPKPIELMKWLVENATTEGGTVCDPFTGSGTTALACVLLGRSFIGVEQHEPYFDIACRRIEEAYRQPRLFAEPKPAPKQEAFL